MPVWWARWCSDRVLHPLRDPLFQLLEEMLAGNLHQAVGWWLPHPKMDPSAPPTKNYQSVWEWEYVAKFRELWGHSSSKASCSCRTSCGRLGGNFIQDHFTHTFLPERQMLPPLPPGKSPSYWGSAQSWTPREPTFDVISVWESRIQSLPASLALLCSPSHPGLKQNPGVIRLGHVPDCIGLSALLNKTVDSLRHGHLLLSLVHEFSPCERLWRVTAGTGNICQRLLNSSRVHML